MKFLFLLITLCTYSFVSYSAQSGIFYFNKKNERVRPEEAFIYRPLPEKVDSGYIIRDYFKASDILQFVGFSITGKNNKAIENSFEGEFIQYHENGNIMATGFFSNGLVNGRYTQYDEDGNVLSSCIIKKKKPFDGTYFSKENKYSYLATYEAGVLKHQVISGLYEQTKARFEIFFNDNGSELRKYYDNNGELIGSSTWTSKFSPDNGIVVYYNLEPFSVRRVVQRKKGLYVNPVRYYYTSGNLKQERFYDTSKKLKSIISYTDDGDCIGELVYKDEKPYDGVEASFGGYIELNTIDETIEYKNGLKHGESTIYIDDMGWILKNYYDNGVLVDTSKVYNKLGDILYTMTYKEGKMWNGTIPGNWYDLLTYENGELLTDTVFFDYGNPQIITNYYGNTKTRKYYNSKNLYLGEATIVNDTIVSGIKVTYYSHNSIEYAALIKSYEGGNLVKECVYNRDEELISEVVKNGLSLYKNTLTGEVVTCIFKNGQPITGTVFEYSGREMYMLKEINYLEGQKHGVCKLYGVYPNYKTYIHGSLHGLCEYADDYLRVNEMYFNGKLHGETKFFFGDDIYSANYDNGNVVDGDVLISDNSGRVVLMSYKNGVERNITIYNSMGIVDKEMYRYNNKYLVEALTLLTQDNYRKLSLSFNNDSTYSGELYYNNCYFNLQNDTILELKQYDSNNVLLIDEIKQGETYLHYMYYFNGVLKQKYAYNRLAIHGSVYSYDINGKLIARGYYNNSVPEKGKYCFFKGASDDEYIILRINRRKIIAELYKNNNKESVLMTKPIDNKANRKSIIRDFLSDLRNENLDYDIPYGIKTLRNSRDLDSVLRCY
ncbi:MAG: hypothetical protein JXB17_05285 [Bacteroidales bacterium]|nr:hypothetical protein [Bacteroidales bacterium]